MCARPLLLPVETLNREFDGKLLLALHAAERGWQPIIGKRSTLNDNVHRFPPAIYFTKGFRSGTGPLFRIIDGLGHAIIGLDEESLVNASDEMLLLRLDAKVLRPVRLAFAWGPNDARILRLSDGFKGKPVIVAGNPRVDLLRPELEDCFAADVARIRERFGRFALFNTNFAMVNHFLPNKSRFRLAKWVPPEKATAMKSGLLGHKAKLLEAFLELIPRLADALKPDSLVIRPHPSENWQLWYDLASGLDNVHVVHEGSVVPWLAAADILIHNGCTSAVEASVVGTPALSYRPVKSAGYDHDLPNRLSHEFGQRDALIARAVEIMHKRGNARHELDEGRRAILDAHVGALTGPLACERLLDEIESHASILEPGAGVGRRIATCIRHIARRTYRNHGDQSKKTSGNPDYLRHKFPGMTLGEISARIVNFQAALDRFNGFGAEEIMPNLFRITSRGT